jgi:hypothetical protein
MVFYVVNESVLQQNSGGHGWWEVVDQFLLRKFKWSCAELVHAARQQ